MKTQSVYNFRKTFAATAVFAGLIFSTETRAETSYPMVCKGGAGMYGTAQSYTSDGHQGQMITITFKRGAVPRNPGAGECVWLDRPISLNEPIKLFYSVAAPSGQDYFITHLNIVPGAGPLKYLLDSIRGQRVFYVHAYRSGSLFVVTRLGP